MKSEVERRPDLQDRLIRDLVLEKHLAQYDDDFKAEILRQIPKNYKSTLGNHRRQFFNIPKRPEDNFLSETEQDEDDDNELKQYRLFFLDPPHPEMSRASEEKPDDLPSSPPSSPGGKPGMSVAPSSNKKKNWKKKMKKKLKRKGPFQHLNNSQHPVLSEDYWYNSPLELWSPPRTGCPRYGDTGCRYVCTC